MMRKPGGKVQMSAVLTKAQMQGLDRLTARICSAGGKLNTNSVLRCLVRVLIEDGRLELKDIKTEEQLLAAIRKALRRR